MHKHPRIGPPRCRCHGHVAPRWWALLPLLAASRCSSPGAPVDAARGDPPDDAGAADAPLVAMEPADSPPPGFVDRVVVAGLTAPTAIRFASDGRLFVAEKGGIISALPADGGGAPTLIADLSPEVFDVGDRGLLDLELDPGFPEVPVIYALYTLDGRVGDGATPGAVPRYHDQCGDPAQGACLAAGRLVRLTLSTSPAATVASETVLVENWGQQFLSHSIGSIAFGPDGMLYASGGDGANYAAADYGNFGSNPLGDPPVAAGVDQTPPSALGGSLRAQVVTPPAPFPTWFNGKVVRIHPDAAPAARWLDPTRPPGPAPVVAAGLRNPFRMTFRPGTSELWIADVGLTTWEEIDVVDLAAPTPNFGWPCYEGPEPLAAFQDLHLDACEALAAAPPHPPWLAYRHDLEVAAGDGCGTGGSAITGLAFYDGGSYPDDLHGGLFFADMSRRCLWVIPPGPDGALDPARRHLFLTDAADPVDLRTGPGGDLFYVDVTGGTIHRIEYAPLESPPPP